MIDYEKSAELNGMGVEELKVWFERFPKSEKRIIRICDCCGGRREIYFYQYCDLCQPCSKKTPEAREVARLKTLEQWDDPEYCNLQVKSHIEFHKDHPEWAIEQSERLCQYHKDHPEVGKLHSERLIQYFIEHPEAKEAARLRGIERFSIRVARDDQSKRLIQYHKDNPDAVDKMSKARIQYYKDYPEIKRLISESVMQYHIDNPEKGKNHSEFMKQFFKDHPESYADRDEMMRGGDDICNHHYIYDHVNPEKYTMKVTRSKHAKIHAWLRKAEIVVPHINEDISPWRYKNGIKY